MPVFNIAANQRLARPVTAYHEGKAVRLGLKNKELANEYKQLEIDADLPNREMELREIQTELQRKREQRLQEQWESIRDTDDGRQLDEALNVAVSAYEQSIASGGRPEEANAFAWETMVDLADRRIPGQREQALIAMEENGFTPESFDIRKVRAFLQERPTGTSVKPTSKMIEGHSMGLKPGSPEWNEWIKGGDDLTAAERNLALARDIYDRTGDYEGISDEKRDTLLSALKIQTGVSGSITMDLKTAEDLADSIIDRTEIGENFIGNNDDDFATTLAFSIMRLAKDGRYGGLELQRRALVDALGFSMKDVEEALAETNANIEQDAKEKDIDPQLWTIDDMIKALADE